MHTRHYNIIQRILVQSDFDCAAIVLGCLEYMDAGIGMRSFGVLRGQPPGRVPLPLPPSTDMRSNHDDLEFNPDAEPDPAPPVQQATCPAEAAAAPGNPMAAKVVSKKKSKRDWDKVKRNHDKQVFVEYHHAQSAELHTKKEFESINLAVGTNVASFVDASLLTRGVNEAQGKPIKTKKGRSKWSGLRFQCDDENCAYSVTWSMFTDVEK